MVIPLKKGSYTGYEIFKLKQKIFAPWKCSQHSSYALKYSRKGL